MQNVKKEDFITKSAETLGEIYDVLGKLPVLEIHGLKAETTALVIIDMVNGFTRDGALRSPRVEGLIPEIVKLCRACGEIGIKKVAFADCHTEKSPEFDAYPPHCIAGTVESEIVDEIKTAGGYRFIPKNSTNGFLEGKFREWLVENYQTDTFIVVGDCTDICIMQFATTLKAWFNMQDRKSRIIVPENAVDTYDYAMHNGDLMHAVSLYNMMGNGIEVVKEIKV